MAISHYISKKRTCDGRRCRALPRGGSAPASGVGDRYPGSNPALGKQRSRDHPGPIDVPDSRSSQLAQTDKRLIHLPPVSALRQFSPADSDRAVSVTSHAAEQCGCAALELPSQVEPLLRTGRMANLLLLNSAVDLHCQNLTSQYRAL